MPSNVSETVLFLDQMSNQIYRWVFPPLLIFGLVGHLLNMILFTRPNLISNSCCNYCLASSCMALIQLIFGQFFRLLRSGYNLVITVVWWCRLRVFLLYAAYLASTILITLAAIDRFASSCHQVKHRRWACIKVARRVIPMVLIVTGLYHSHILVLFVIDREQGNECWAPRGTVYRLVFDATFLFAHGLMSPLLMGIFGFLTIHNISQRRVSRQHNITSDMKRHRLRDFQRMTLVQISSVVVLTLPFAIYKLHRTLTHHHHKTPEQLAWERLAMCIVRVLWFSHDSIAFYIYSLASVKFRHELFEFLHERFIRARVRAPTISTSLESSVEKQEPPLTRQLLELECVDV
jgi:hypothetical protein